MFVRALILSSEGKSSTPVYIGPPHADTVKFSGVSCLSAEIRNIGPSHADAAKDFETPLNFGKFHDFWTNKISSGDGVKLKSAIHHVTLRQMI